MYVSMFTGIIVHALLQVEEQKLANKEDFIIHTQLPSSPVIIITSYSTYPATVYWLNL